MTHKGADMLNRIGFPDETPCPDCGRPIEGEEDPLGIVYRCTSLDCGSTYTGEDLFPENYPPLSLPVRPAPAVPDDVASLSAAREAAAAIAMREAAAEVAGVTWFDSLSEQTATHQMKAILALPIPTDPAAALDRLIAERVREARNMAWDEAADIMDGYGQHGYAEEFRARICVARGSKEGRDV